jgi:hypothetical protein
MSRSSVATDDFNRASIGANWLQLADLIGGTMEISASTVCYGTSAQGDSGRQAARWAGSGTFSNDQYSSIVISGITTALNDNYGIGVICRASSDTNSNRDYYEAFMYNTSSGSTQTIRFGKYVNNVYTSFNDATVTIGNGDRIELECVGTTIRVCKNGTALGGSFTTTDSSLTTGKPGISGAGGTNIFGDSWEGGDVTAGVTAAMTGSALTGGHGTQTPSTTVAL